MPPRNLGLLLLLIRCTRPAGAASPAACLPASEVGRVARVMMCIKVSPQLTREAVS